MTQDQELAVLHPNPITQDINGVTITFKKVVVRTISPFSHAVNAILADEKVTELVSLAVVNGSFEVMQAADIVQDIVAQYADNIITAIALTTDVDVKWLEEQELDVLIAIAHKVVEVNSSYFLPKVMPRFLAAIQKVQAQDGQQLMPGLSNTGTASKI